MPKTLLILAAIAALLTLGSLWADRQLDATSEAAPIDTPDHSVPLPSLRIAAGPDRVVLSGRLPDEIERASIVRRARLLYGSGRVVDQLQTGGVANPSWLTAAFLPDLRTVVHATAVLEDARLVIEGVVDSPTALEAVAASVAPFRSRGLQVINRLVMQASLAPSGS